MANAFLSPSQPPNPPPPPSFPPPPPPAAVRSDTGFGFSSDRAAALKVSPSVLLIIIILAIVFFVSGLLHLLVRFLWRPHGRDPDDADNVTALQGQLQQLFHLHDAGVDQSFIDTLPVFHYNAIIGLKKYPFDCAVCLCEFEPEDKLRLLPKCSHAFHTECIDTWLLSHSTCPLCRASLLPDFSANSGNNCSPIVLVLESGSESSREIFPEREGPVIRDSGDFEFGSTRISKSGDLAPGGNGNGNSLDLKLAGDGVEKVVTVKLGKFRNVDGGGGGGEGSSATSNVDARRCFSMGSFAYVLDESSSLQVPIRTPMKKKQSSNKKCSLPLTPGHRPAMSECDCESRRDFRFAGFDVAAATRVEDFAAAAAGSGSSDGAAIGGNRKESFSISKIWLRGKKEKDSSRRAVSFRFPAHRNVAGGGGGSDELKGGNGDKNGKFETRSHVSEWENGGSEFGFDEENQSCYSIDSQARAPSFARRTLLWLTGRQNKVVHSSSASNL